MRALFEKKRILRIDMPGGDAEDDSKDEGDGTTTITDLQPSQ